MSLLALSLLLNVTNVCSKPRILTTDHYVWNKTDDARLVEIKKQCSPMCVVWIRKWGEGRYHVSCGKVN